MANGNLNPPVTPPELPKKSAGECGEINQVCFDEISGTDKLPVVAAQNPYKARLAKHNTQLTSP